MTKHTRGPWFTENYADGTIQICGNLVDRGEDEMSYTTIVEAMTPCPEVEANTSLILAAPDLLAALEKGVTRLETNLGDERDMSRGSMTYLLEIFQDAIARAKGESK